MKNYWLDRRESNEPIRITVDYALRTLHYSYAEIHKMTLWQLAAIYQQALNAKRPASTGEMEERE